MLLLSGHSNVLCTPANTCFYELKQWYPLTLYRVKM
uniref:Uncharacterized protein n=1 Tax=Anguilla anguilla TaxID=7936 RepID=A0A0E9V102_ANGAN